MIRTIIADDHKLIRDGIKKLFENEMDLSVVAETGDPFEVASLVEKTEFDVLLLDLNFPNRSGLDVLKDVKLISPKTKILVLSMYPEEKYAIRILKAGANGYVSKEGNPDEIINAVRRIYDGRKYISAELSDKLIDELDKPSVKNPHENLSDREFQVFIGIANGKGQTQLAEELNISVSTINTYRSRILQKLEVSNSAELIHYALKHNLIE